MFTLAALTGGIAIGVCVHLAQEPKKYNTVLDITDAESAEAFLKILERGDGADALADRVGRIFEAFPPSEKTMSRWSLLQQKHQGEGGVQEYSTTFIYAIATDVISFLNKKNIHPNIVRCHSEPSISSQHNTFEPDSREHRRWSLLHHFPRTLEGWGRNLHRYLHMESHRVKFRSPSPSSV